MAASVQQQGGELRRDSCCSPLAVDSSRSPPAASCCSPLAVASCNPPAAASCCSTLAVAAGIACCSTLVVATGIACCCPLAVAAAATAIQRPPILDNWLFILKVLSPIDTEQKFRYREAHAYSKRTTASRSAAHLRDSKRTTASRSAAHLRDSKRTTARIHADAPQGAFWLAL